MHKLEYQQVNGHNNFDTLAKNLITLRMVKSDYGYGRTNIFQIPCPTIKTPKKYHFRYDNDKIIMDDICFNIMK